MRSMEHLWLLSNVTHESRKQFKFIVFPSTTCLLVGAIGFGRAFLSRGEADRIWYLQAYLTFWLSHRGLIPPASAIWRVPNKWREERSAHFERFLALPFEPNHQSSDLLFCCKPCCLRNKHVKSIFVFVDDDTRPWRGSALGQSALPNRQIGIRPKPCVGSQRHVRGRSPLLLAPHWYNSLCSFFRPPTSKTNPNQRFLRLFQKNEGQRLRQMT